MSHHPDYDYFPDHHPAPQAAQQITAEINTGELIRFVLKLFSYVAFLLFVVNDGLNNPESFETKFLTIPYLIGGLALTRSICEALDHHYDFHAGLFALGLSTLSALA